MKTTSRVLFSFGFLMILMSNSQAQVSREMAVVSEILDQYHNAAAEGDWDRYFDFLSDDAVFLGSDVSERWEKEEFRAYALGSNGWIYTPQSRRVNFTPDGNTAWFDEVLLSRSYGTSRGTGVLIKVDSTWKISQYHLVFPIPNALARKFTDEIKEFEAQQR